MHTGCSTTTPHILQILQPAYRRYCRPDSHHPSLAMSRITRPSGPTLPCQGPAIQHKLLLLQCITLNNAVMILGRH